MKVEKQIWEQAMNNLIERRKDATYKYTAPAKIIDFENHFKKCILGKSVLDVGCGSMSMKKYCTGEYVGIDAFPINDEVIFAEIETFETDRTFETVIAFAVLDGLYDLKKAIENMKNLCSKNIILLTGLNIPPDKYHTFELSEKLLTDLMSEGKRFNLSYKEELSPKVFLMEYKIHV